MNFGSHHFFQADGSPLHDAGLILADLIPLAQTKPFPLLLHAQRMFAAEKYFHDSTACGIVDHFGADRIFHRSEFFNDAVGRSIRTGSGKIPSVLHHIVVELLIDRAILAADFSLIESMYDSFASSWENALADLSRGMEIDTNARHACMGFSEHRTILGYDDFARIAQTLHRIGIRTGIRIDELGEIPLVLERIFSELEPDIKSFLETSKGIFRAIPIDVSIKARID